VLEVSLRKAGFTVTPAASVTDALEKLELHAPDLIISETKFPADPDGFELRRRVRASPDWAEIPFVFLTAETAIEHKIRGLELGVDDYLTKPIYIKEIVTRINILLQKRQRAHFDERKDGVRFAGRVTDMPVVDVIQTIEVSRKSGVIQFVADRSRTAAIYFRDGKVIDAEAGTLQGEDAVYRLLTWSEGEFEVMFRTVRRREVITTSSQGLLMEGMRRLDEWSRLLEQLPALSHRFEIDTQELAGRLGEVPDDNNPILRLIDGKRSLLEVIDASSFGDLECLQAISKLYFEGLLMDLDPDKRAKRDTGRPVPLLVVEAQTPIEEVASGPMTYTPESFVDEVTPPPAAHLAAVPEPSAPAVTGGTAGPLLGSYRPSSLRLIDEAVAAAQAIDPSLFEDDSTALAEPPPAQLARVQLKKVARTPEMLPAIRDAISTMEPAAPDAAPDAIEDDNSGVPRPMDGGEPDPTSRALDDADDDDDDDDDDDGDDDRDDDADADAADDADDRDEVTQPERPAFVARREQTGLRMTSSHGHDRAETSGEVNTEADASEDRDPARELITIMPRRNTRELSEQPVVVPADPGPASAREPVVNFARPRSPSLPPLPPRTSMAGGVARARGPGPIVIALAAVATVLAGTAIYSYVHGHRGSRVITGVAADRDAGGERAGEDANAAALVAPAGDAGGAVTVPLDAGPGRPPPLVATPLDAGDPSNAGVVPPLDRNKEASALKDRANAALEEGDADKALELANQALKLRRTAQALLTRGRALERLNHLDQALDAFDGALELAPTFPQTWQAKGMALWSARRRDEARSVLEEYLKLAPGAKDAGAVRQMLDAHP
jgi:DNA-binding response OmpR family regulator